MYKIDELINNYTKKELLEAIYTIERQELEDKYGTIKGKILNYTVLDDIHDKYYYRYLVNVSGGCEGYSIVFKSTKQLTEQEIINIILDYDKQEDIISDYENIEIDYVYHLQEILVNKEIDDEIEVL